MLRVTDDPRLIPLSQGKAALVDAADYVWLSAFTWFYNEHAGGYACRNVVTEDGQRRIELMHRVINRTPDGLDTDHISGDKLDNRRSNLRTLTRKQNVRLRHVVNSNNTSGCRGVSFDQSRRKWAAYIKADYRKINLGRFATLDAAVAARRAAEAIYHA